MWVGIDVCMSVGPFFYRRLYERRSLLLLEAVEYKS